MNMSYFYIFDARDARNAFNLYQKYKVREHIESFAKNNVSQSDSKFLNSELNLEKMYELYKCENAYPVQRSFYKKMFYEHFNLSFGVARSPRKQMNQLSRASYH